MATAITAARPASSSPRLTRAVQRLIFLVSLLSIMASASHAERLPIRTYTPADGLASATIHRIVRDSRGFLWFCTRGGLSRFDGTRFRTYDERDGLPERVVNDFLESRSGTYWVATNGGGVCRLDPSLETLSGPGDGKGTDPAGPRSRFKVYPVGAEVLSNRVNQLCEDQAGRLWATTDGGLFVLEDQNGQVGFRHVDLGPVAGPAPDIPVDCILADSRGALWIGTTNAGVIERLPDGRLRHYSTSQGLPSNYVTKLIEDRQGQLWAGTSNGLCLLADHPDNRGSIVSGTYPTTAFGLEPESIQSPGQLPNRNRQHTDTGYVTAIFESQAGRLWIGTRGLTEFDGMRFHSYGLANGLSGARILSLAEDADGNLWMGTEGAGALKLTSTGFISYTQADGPGLVHIYNILEDETGAVIAASDNWRINRFDGSKFVGVRPALPPDSFVPWASTDVYLDRERCWWVLTDKGLCRYPKVNSVVELSTTRPIVYTTLDGLPVNQIASIYEDRHGDIWVGMNGGGGLIRKDRSSGAIHRFPELNRLAPENGPSSICEDRSGNLWVSFLDGGLARYRNKSFDTFTSSEGLPRGGNTAIFLDHAGRLWAPSHLGGLTRIDDPDAERPHFATYTTSDGLASNGVRCVTEDTLGRIYVGAGAGVDRLDPDTGAIKHFTTADGLANDYVVSAFRDHQGRLWFGTLNGLSRLDPQPDRTVEPRAALINGLRVGGATYPVSELGQASVPEMTLGPGQNSIQIEFFAVGFVQGALRYQYRLSGSGQGWSEPTDQRLVDYAAVAPGTYRFEVRAIYAGGVVSASPAFFAFTILPPLWRRWWVVSLAALVIGIAAYGLHLNRLRRLVELERVRARIAADLHDDIGSSLSQIALLSGVLRTQLERGEAVAVKTISTMYRVSAESLDSMSDIVWAINPQRDHLVDLSRRMRRFASEILPARDINLSFKGPEDDRDLRLGADLRREVYLIFKEIINNAARHSGCGQVEVELGRDGSWIQL
jgi:ligand-binding sensor domain-containing protein